MLAVTDETQSVSIMTLSVALISPQEKRRRDVAQVLSGSQAAITREYKSYPEADEILEILNSHFDVIVIDLDPDPESALETIESICGGKTSLTVMVYSSQSDQELMLRCMRAGAREFLSEPVNPGAIAEALVRAALRREELRRHKKALGKVFVFTGSKGGSGVTTVATNFALSLARASAAKVALLDLDLHLGDAALTLGLTAKYSVMDALKNAKRLDPDMLSALLEEHKSGLFVLAAPDRVDNLHPEQASLEKLLRIARESFSCVVVDAGNITGLVREMLFEAATTVYLVAQVGLSELRNANRFISHYFGETDGHKLEVVLNRFTGRSMEIDEAAITKALTRPAKWKIPNDYRAVRRAQNTGVPIVSERSGISKVISEMAVAASGQAAHKKKKPFSLFG